MVEVKRTLVKSIPELWEIVDGPELIGRVSAELFRSRPVEVVEREPRRRLAWQVSATPPARVELVLAENDWGTRVVIRVDRQDAAPEFTGAVLKRLLGDLGSDQRLPLPPPERGAAEAKRPRLPRLERERRADRPTRGIRHRGGDLDELFRVYANLTTVLGEAEDAMRTIEARTAEDRLVKRAVGSFAQFEREVGRLQERARRVVAAAATEEVDRRLERSIAPLLREIEARLTDALRGSTAPVRAADVLEEDSRPAAAHLIVRKAPTGIEPV